MANFPTLKLTNAGLNLLTNVQGGADTLTFSKVVLGDGDLSVPLANLTSLVSQKIELPISESKKVGTGTYQIGAFFSNTDISLGFWWKEIGVYAKGNDGAEILCYYSYAGDASDYIPTGSDERVEKYIYLSMAIGNAENVTVEINGSDTFIPVADKGKAGGVAPLNENGKVPNEHLPNITADTVGLGKVPNVATNDQTPTYTESSTLTNLTSGEKLSVAFGKIKKAITDLMTHLANTTLHITATERTTWNAKANTKYSTNVSVAVSSFVSSGNTNFPYKAEITVSGVTATGWFPIVAFSTAALETGIFDNAPVETGANKVIIYAKEKPTSAITIDAIKVVY